MFGISDNKNQDNADDPYVMPQPSEPVADSPAPTPPADPPSAPVTDTASPAPGPAASVPFLNDYSTSTDTSSPPAFAPSAPPMPTPPPEISNAVPAMPQPPEASSTPEPEPTSPSSESEPSGKPSAAALMGGSSDEDLVNMKQQALQSLAPLIDHLEQTPEEKFKTTMMLIQASDNAELVKEAYEAANQIKDDKVRAQALLDVVNEINYFTHQSSNTPKQPAD